MGNPSTTWTEHVARLEREVMAHPESQAFLHSSVTKASGETIQYRPFSEIQAELTAARRELARSQMASGGFTFFLAEAAP